MRVRQFRRAEIFLAYNRLDARQRDFQFFRIGRDGRKKSALHRARLRRLGSDRDFAHRRRGRMRAQIQLQELQQGSGIPHGHGQTE